MVYSGHAGLLVAVSNMVEVATETYSGSQVATQNKARVLYRDFKV